MSSQLKGPSDGNWSVFAEQVVAERDKALSLLSDAEVERDRIQDQLDASLKKIEMLKSELEVAKAFHALAIKERDHERLRRILDNV